MGNPINNLRRIALGIFLLVIAGLSACTGAGGGGGGGGGGSNATPVVGTGTPVAVEIPAVGDVSDVMYITSPVMTAAGGKLSTQSMAKTSMSSPYKVLSSETYGAGDSVNACKIANGTRGLLRSGAHPDLELCVLKNTIAPGMTAAGVKIDDGQPHDAAAWAMTGYGAAKANFRFTLTKDASGAVTQFEMFVCAGDHQIEYTKEVFDPSNGVVTITSKAVEGDPKSPQYTASLGVTGTIKAINGIPQYTAKHTIQTSREVTLTDSDGNPVDVRSQASTLDQDAVTGTFDGFITNEGPYSTVTDRSIGHFSLTYAGDPEKNSDLFNYDIGAGASHLIEDSLDQTQCWTPSGAITLVPCPPYSDAIIGRTPAALRPVESAVFATGETVDCISIKPVFIAGGPDNPVNIDNSVCAGFGRDLDDHMDCFTAIYGDFTVAATSDGQALSTDSNRPTHVGSSPTIVLTTNYTPYLQSFISNTIKLQWQGCQEPLTDSAFDQNNWSGAATDQNPEAMALALHPTLCNTTYTLTLSKDLSGINGNSIAGTQTYYLAP